MNNAPTQPCFPILSATIEICAELDDSTEKSETMHMLIEEYTRHLIESTKIYTSQKYNVCFPYTIIRLQDIAEAIYHRTAPPVVVQSYATNPSPPKLKPPLSQQKQKKHEICFIFGTSFSIHAGHPYHWIEYGIDMIVKKLPEALYLISQEKIPQNFEVYGIGNPAGELGLVTEEFITEAGEKPFEHLGLLYAEFIINTLKCTHSDKNLSPLLRLWGVSMGASIAVTTACALLEQKQCSQSAADAKESCLPLVRVTTQSPVTRNKGVLRKLQIKTGFLVELACQVLTNKYSRRVGRAERLFITKIHAKLNDRGIKTHTDTAETEIKLRLIQKLIAQFINGIPAPDHLKINEIIGIYDPLDYSRDFQKIAFVQKNHAAGSLGASIIPAKKPTRKRIFAIKMTHTPAVVRYNYFRRLIYVAQIIQKPENRCNASTSRTP